MKLSLFSYCTLFLFVMGHPVRAQKNPAKKFFVPQISVKMSFSGDLNEVYQFAGPLGNQLKGTPEKPDSACENTSSFQQVLYRQKKCLQIWTTLKCGPNGQSFEYKPHRFLIDLKSPEKLIFLPVLSEKFRKISLQVSDIQIKDKPPKK